MAKPDVTLRFATGPTPPPGAAGYIIHLNRARGHFYFTQPADFSISL
jgi:hypothetical protein